MPRSLERLSLVPKDRRERSERQEERRALEHVAQVLAVPLKAVALKAVPRGQPRRRRA